MPGVKEKCGGFRPGAGRPSQASGRKKKRITVSLDEILLDRLKERAQVSGKNVSELLSDILIYDASLIGFEEHHYWQMGEEAYQNYLQERARREREAKERHEREQRRKREREFRDFFSSFQQQCNSYDETFSKCFTAVQLKREYRNLCKTLHPDAGGNPERFKDMHAAYERAKTKLGA